MSSAKRYKQPSENHRNQDIPPRFKRQKSQSMQQTMEIANKNSQPSVRNRKNVLGDSISPNTSSSSLLKNSQYPKEGRKIVKKLSTQRAQSHAEKNLMKPQSQPFVLSPMENKLFSIMRCDNEFDFQNQNCSDIQQTGPTINLNDQHLHSNMVFVPTQHSPSGYDLQKPEYSDPDIRTIEMLRELERVADQTDVGNEENGNDKSHLVSHHLRMLMCAVDRYTQGVDEDVSDSGSDVGSNHEDRQSIPSPPNPNSDIGLVSGYGTKDNGLHPYPNNQFVSSQFPSQFGVSNQHALTSWNLWSTPQFNSLDVYDSSRPVIQPSPFSFDHGMYYARDACF